MELAGADENNLSDTVETTPQEILIMTHARISIVQACEYILFLIISKKSTGVTDIGRNLVGRSTRAGQNGSYLRSVQCVWSMHDMGDKINITLTNRKTVNNNVMNSK